MSAWHSRPPEAILAELETSLDRGLSAAQAARRLEQYGPNALDQPKRGGPAARLLAQLKDPMILVLLAAAGLSLAASGFHDWGDAVIILVIVLVNAVLSISQEGSAERALEALRSMSAPHVRAVRDGRLIQLESRALVPGDIIHLEAGDLVPADARILDCSALKTDESAMTGESLPVSKKAVSRLSAETPLGDRVNMVLSGTVVTNGRAVCVVTDTGMRSEMGRIAGLLRDAGDPPTPLQLRMVEISRVLSLLCLLVCAVTFGVGLIQGKELLDMFLTAVSLAVAAIPEGLPAIVTIVLALGVQRMVRHNAIIKRLPAVETLGCASVICSDKTGTLTQNKMTVAELWALSPTHRRDLLTVGALCSDARLTCAANGAASVSGDPTEAALVERAWTEGLDKDELERTFPRRGELPFDSGRKLMSTLHPRPGGGWRLMVKGAPDVLLARCRFALSGGAVPLTDALRRRILEANAAMAARALRVLGTAWRDLDALPRQLDSALLEQELTFVGLAGMIDPPRPQVKLAVERCRAAGIRPVMITGDHKLTAVAIARELNIFRPGDLAVTGEELDFMPQELLEQEVERFSVYARVSPEHKMRIVRAWQARGHTVAMTGDGVNDAPALKTADIGCAMGVSGTDVAKGAADMILTDDDFTTIVRAVEQGRGIYANIKKAIHYLLSCNIGEILTIFTATLFRWEQMPLVPVQLLWLNLVTDSLPALALGMEPVEHDVMSRAPRPAGASLFDRAFSLRLLWQGVMVGALTLLAYWLGRELLPGCSPAAANTMAFATLTLSQLFHAFDVRSEDCSLLHIGLFSNRAMDRAFLAGLAMQLSVLCLPPLQTMFSTVPLSRVQWLAVLALAAAPVFICELEKAVRRALRPGHFSYGKDRPPVVQ